MICADQQANTNESAKPVSCRPRSRLGDAASSHSLDHGSRFPETVGINPVTVVWVTTGLLENRYGVRTGLLYLHRARSPCYCPLATIQRPVIILSNCCALSKLIFCCLLQTVSPSHFRLRRLVQNIKAFRLLQAFFRTFCENPHPCSPDCFVPCAAASATEYYFQRDRVLSFMLL